MLILLAAVDGDALDAWAWADAGAGTCLACTCAQPKRRRRTQQRREHNTLPPDTESVDDALRFGCGWV